MSSVRNPEKFAERNAMKEERARDRLVAMQEYEAAQAAQKENMARLRELRLAREAAEIPQVKPKTRARKSSALRA
jgi:hypothetical protein